MNALDPNAVAGIVNLYKPRGRTSAQYVYRLRGIFGIRKIGHAGTLDPFADGVLLACLGRGTKLVESLMGLGKHYQTTLRLGVTNATFDTERPFDPVDVAVPPTTEQVAEAVARFVGDVEQVPPAFSAVKIDGVPSYKLAAQGRARTKPARRVRIERIDVTDYRWPHLSLEIRCGRGTYIRAISRDLGRALGCGACCQALSRLSVGPFCLADAVNLEEATPESVRSALISVPEALRRIRGP